MVLLEKFTTTAASPRLRVPVLPAVAASPAPTRAAAFTSLPVRKLNILFSDSAILRPRFL
jgi:hypothetical protein